MRVDFWRTLRLPWRAPREIEDEVDDEISFHLEMRARELIDSGVDPDEARARAAEAFGDVAATRADYLARRARDLRRARSRMSLEDLVRDLGFAARSLRRRPGFSATAVLVLALGIGAPTTVFTLVDTIFFDRPAHVAEPHRLLRVFRSWTSGGSGGSLGNPDYEYYRDNASTLAGLAAYGGRTEVAYRVGGGDPSQLELLFASANYFDVLGVSPALGRWFRPEESTSPGSHPVAVLSHGFWTRAVGADPDVLGRTLTVNGIAHTVVGVAPEGFSGISPLESAPDAWVPIAMAGVVQRLEDEAWWSRHPDYVSNWLDVVGRAAPGVSTGAAQANLVALGEGLTYEGRDAEERLTATRQFLYRPSQEASLQSLSRILVAAVLIVLLVAAANVAVLLLSRATTRTREIGIRTALGAGGGRLVRLLVAESVLLGLLGGALGIGLAYTLSGAAATLLPLPFEPVFRPDPGVLAAAAALALVTAVAVGLPPALHGARLDLRRAMHDEASAGAWGGRDGLRGVLVVSQVSMSVVLVAGAFLFARSFWAASHQDLGFEHEDVLVVGVSLRSLDYDADRGRTFIREALARLGALPGVEAVTTSRQIPFLGDWSTDIRPPGVPETEESYDPITVYLNAVGPGYFDVTGIEIVRGRALDERDRPGATPATVINETLAERLWPGEDPVGRILPRGGMVVVGVARDATYAALGETPLPQAYVPVLQSYMADLRFFARAGSDAAALAGPVQAELRRIEPRLAFEIVTTLESVVDDELARYEVSAVLVGLFGAIALLLAAAGLYGVVSFLVSRRTREIGVRMALGADRGQVAARVLGSALRLAALGVVIGLAGAAALRGFTESLLFGVDPGDPLPLLGASLVLLAVTAIAAAGPARRATRVDPLDALRAD
jgi:predicted permease